MTSPRRLENVSTHVDRANQPATNNEATREPTRQSTPTNHEPTSVPSFATVGSGSFNQLPKEKFRCHAIAGAGQPCQGFRRRGSTFCIFHDPAYRETLVETSRAAGRASGEARRPKIDAITPIDLSKRANRRDLLHYLAAAELKSAISPAQAKSIRETIQAAEAYAPAFEPISRGDMGGFAALFDFSGFPPIDANQNSLG